MVAVAIRPEDVEAATAPYEAFWDYIHDNGNDEAFEFNWSGEIMDRALLYLREKNIDLTKAKLLPTGRDELAFLIYDTVAKEKFVDKLDPVNFNQMELGNWLEEYVWGTPPDGVMDAIRNLHVFFKMIDDEHVVVLHTDWIAGVIHSKPLKKQKAAVPKRRMIEYLCDQCGPRLEGYGGTKRLSDIPVGEAHTCCDTFIITTKVVDGKEVEESKDVTNRLDSWCTAPATGCYRMKL